MSLRGLFRLTWLEIKIFVREPLGLIGTVFVPVLVFVLVSRLLGPRVAVPSSDIPRFASVDLPIFVSLLMVVSAALSLINIMAIYRDGGILKRLRATPLRPYTILTAHVLVKIVFTAITLALMLLAGRRYFPIGAGVPVVSFAVALVISTLSVLSVGFVIASAVPTARFAQPLGTLVLYPMLGISGLFFPVAILPPAFRALARLFPTTYAVSLLRGIWIGDPWLRHAGDVAALVALFLVFTAIATRVFRWE
jgi:ABC-2 type transport system permease protein